MIAAQELSRYGIGASDIAAICGLNPYAAPITVWRRKLGLDSEFAGNERTMWGQALEPLVREQYRLRNGVDVWVPDKSLFHPKVEWARATPDGIVLARPNEPVPTTDNWLHCVQIKTVGPRAIPRWEHDSIPDEYALQVQWEMFVTDLPRCDIAALLGGQEYVERVVHRDNEVIESALEIATKFWELVLSGTEPDVDETDAYRNHLQDKIKRSQKQGHVLGVTNETAYLAKMLREQRANLRNVESEVQRIENEIMAIMAREGAEACITPDGQITWKASKPRDLTDWKAVMRDVENEFGVLGEAITALVAKHTTQAKESRPFKVPRSWSAE